MKIVCAQAELAEALNVVGKAISQNTTLPVLNNVLLVAEGNRLRFAGTNLEIAIETFINAEVKAEGSITVPAKLLIGYISLLKDEKVELTAEEGATLSIKCASSQTKIKGIAAEEFPMIPKVNKESVFKVSKKDLDTAITQTVFAASSNTARPVLSGILFDLKKDSLKMVATDSYRLAEKKLVLAEKVELDLQAIVPARTVAELGKILSKSSAELVEINVSKNQILFVVDDTRMISRLIEGKFPPYEKIIPQSSRTKVDLKTEEVSLVVRRVGLFAKENNNNIKISVTNDGKVQVATDETKVGEEKAELSGKVEGENNKIALNSQYLLDALNYIQAEEITLELDDKLSPAVIKITKEEEKTYMYIIMPLKI
ncbi:MAG: DNA polymerase III subunit beta [Candidatus Altimarinota bacterium]